MVSHPLLDSLAGAGIRLGLGRMRDFLASVGNPERRYPLVHIGGTNGKGSVSRLIDASWRASGLRVGLHTSPHLQEVNERVVVDGAPIDDAELLALIERIDAARRAWAAANLPPDEPYPLTYFEFTVALAFAAFADAKVDAAVIEVGMGGRLDATNVCVPNATAIVTIDLDHCAELGFDPAAIAGEKAGIIKPGVPCVVGPLPAEALQVIRSVAAERGAPLSVWGEDFEAFGASSNFHYRGRERYEGLELRLLGDHQVVNAGVALRVMELAGLPVSEAQLRAGLAGATHAGRLEWLAPDLLVDGAHNPAGASSLAAFLSSLPDTRRRTLVLGGGLDKDIRSVAAALAPVVSRIFTTAGSHPKARSPWNVAAELEGIGAPVTPAGALHEAVAAARNGSDLVIVAGSLYLVGELRAALGLAPPDRGVPSA